MLRSISATVKQASKLTGLNAPSSHRVTACRCFMTKLLNSVLNIYDKGRVEEFGADRVCAEWILKTGGRIRWVGSDDWVDSYNMLPSDNVPAELEVFRLQDIDASDAAVMSGGFGHLRDLKDLRSVKLHNCKYLDDECIKVLGTTHETVEQLQISSTKKVTDKGLMNLTIFRHLTDLHLKDLPGVRDVNGCYEKLAHALPSCDIIYVDALKQQSQNKQNNQSSNP